MLSTGHTRPGTRAADDVPETHRAQKHPRKLPDAAPLTFPQGRSRVASADRTLLGPRLHDRAEAGRMLAERLAYYANSDAVVVAVANGAVPIACEAAATLGLELRYLAFSVIACPAHPQLAIGAVSEPGGNAVQNKELLDSVKVTDDEFRRLCDDQRAHLVAMTNSWSGLALQLGDISGRTAIVVIDVDEVNKVGLVRLVIRLLLATCRDSPPKSLVIASPAISPDTVQMVKPHAGRAESLVFDGYIEWICIEGGERNVPEKLDHCYTNFSPVSDNEVAYILKNFSQRNLDFWLPGGLAPFDAPQ